MFDVFPDTPLWKTIQNKIRCIGGILIERQPHNKQIPFQPKHLPINELLSALQKHEKQRYLFGMYRMAQENELISEI